MEAESRKRGREQETTERLQWESVAKKVNKDGYYRGRGMEEEEEEEVVEKEMGVFEFPWQKGREGVMTEEEWKEAGVVLGDTFLGTLGSSCREREEEEEVEVEIGGGGMRWMEEITSSSSSCSSTTLSLSLSLNLEQEEEEEEESWDDRDGIWASLLH